MKRYPIRATLLSPLALRRDRQSDRSEGVNSAAGTVVRGALARAYLQQIGQADEGFRRLFLDDSQCRFGPLDPARETLPLTSLSCKRHPGFRSETPGAHGVVDVLWTRVAARLSHSPTPIGPPVCWVCGQDLKPLAGFFDGDLPKASRSMRRIVTAHVGIDRATSTAAESIFFSLESLDSNPNPDPNLPDLVGWIDATDEAQGQLQSLLEREGSLVMLGHGRTRGYGRVRLELDEPRTEQRTPDHWREWNGDLLDYLSRPGFEIPLEDCCESFAFSLTFPTGAIIVDDLLRSSLDPADEVGWLPRLPSVDDPRPLRDRKFQELVGGRLWSLGGVARHERIRGWNAAHGLPRQDEWSIARGSVFAYWFEGEADALHTLLDRLQRLENDGIGLRRGEGLGEVVVSDEFHRKYHQQEDMPK